jgi:CheY-like chemotaxis protein
VSEILVVDDEADMRMALRNVLVRDGHRVAEASNGESALNHISHNQVDLVLLDVRLAGYDGVQTLRKIRELKKDLPVIMITGYGSVETAVELMKLGANQYLQKPFDNHHLIQTVNKVLSGAPRVGGDPGVLKRSLLSKLALRSPDAPTPPAKTADTKPASASTAPADPAPPQPAPSKPAPSKPKKRPADIDSTAKPKPPPSSPPPAFRPPGVSSAPPPLPDPGTNVVPHALGFLAVAAVIGLIVWFSIPKIDNRDFNLLTKNPSGLSWTSDGLWVSDWAAGSISLLDSNMTPVRTIKIPGAHPTGLCVTDHYVFISDSWRKVIERRKLDDQLTLDVSLASPGPSPAGLYFDGTYLWSADSEEGKVYRHDFNSLDAKLFYPTPNRAPIGVYVEGSTMWTADADTRLIYRHEIGPNLPVKATFRLVSIAQGQEPLSAFTVHEGHYWLARDGSLSLLKRHPSAFLEK